MSWLTDGYTLGFIVFLCLLAFLSVVHLSQKSKRMPLLFLGTIWLSVLTTPLFELFCYYRVYLFAKTQSRLMLNAAGYLQASLLVFLVCFALSAYLAISIYRNPGFEKTKQLIMSLAVNVTCGAVTLIEAPKLVWPLANSMVLDATVPAFMLLFLFNMAGGIFGLMSFRKLRQIR